MSITTDCKTSIGLQSMLLSMLARFLPIVVGKAYEHHIGRHCIQLLTYSYTNKNNLLTALYSKLYICSAQSENLRNLEIALRILGIPRLRTIVA